MEENNKVEILPSKSTEELGFWMDGYLKSNLDIIRTVMDKNLDWDFHYICSGLERSGKSVFTMQICKYIDSKFNIDNIVFSSVDFIQKSKELPKNSAILWDEAVEGGSTRESITNIGTTLKKFVAQMGQKNLFVIMNIPDFFDLNKNLALRRSSGLFRVYALDYFSRGYWGYYDRERKKNLWLLGYKTRDYDKQRYNVHGRFINHYVVDKEQYLLKKNESLMKSSELLEKNKIVRGGLNTLQLSSLVYHLGEDKGLSYSEISKYINKSKTTTAEYYHKHNIKDCFICNKGGFSKD